MLDNIIDKNIMFLQNHGIKMNSDERAIYKYGLQILYYYIIDLIVVFSLAYMFGRLYETAIMTMVFAILQVFGGGYHAKTALKCLMTMISGVGVGNVFSMMIVDKPILNIILTVVISGIILILTPIMNKKHPVSTKVKHRSKLIIRFIVILILIVITILIYFSKDAEVAVITVTLGLYLISLTAANLMNDR